MDEPATNPDNPIYVALQSYLQEPHLNQPGKLAPTDSKWGETRAFLVDLIKFLEGFPRQGLWYTDTALTAKASFQIFDKAFVNLEGVYRSDDGLERTWPLKLLTFVGTMEDWVARKPTVKEGPTPEELRDTALEVIGVLVQSLRRDVTLLPNSNDQIWRVSKEFTLECIAAIGDVVEAAGVVPFASFHVSLFQAPRISEPAVFSDNEMVSTFVVTHEGQAAHVLIDLLHVTLPHDNTGGQIECDHLFQDILRSQIQAADTVFQFCLSAPFRKEVDKIAAVRRILSLVSPPALQKLTHSYLNRLLYWRLADGPKTEWQQADLDLAAAFKRDKFPENMPDAVMLVIDVLKQQEWGEDDGALRDACYSYISCTCGNASVEHLRLLQTILANEQREEGQRALTAVDIRLAVLEAPLPTPGGRKRKRLDDIRGFIESGMVRHLLPPNSMMGLDQAIDDSAWTEAVLRVLHDVCATPLHDVTDTFRESQASFLKQLPCLLHHPEDETCDPELVVDRVFALAPTAIQAADRLLETQTSPNVWKAVLVMVQSFLRHSTLAPGDVQIVEPLLHRGVAHEDRGVRLTAGKVVHCFIDSFRQQHGHCMPSVDPLLRMLTDLTKLGGPKVKESSITTLGLLGRTPDLSTQGAVILGIIAQLGNSTSFIQALAYSQLLNLSRHHAKGPFALLSPHLTLISRYVVPQICSAPTYLTEICRFLGRTVVDFLTISQASALPHLVAEMAKEPLQTVARHLDKSVGAMLLPHASKILAHLYMVHPMNKSNQGLVFLADLVVNGPSGLDMLVNSHRIEILSELVIHMADKTKAKIATTALQRIQITFKKDSTAPLGEFLQPFTLGILSHLNTAIMTSRGTASTPYKRQVIQSLGTLITTVGKAISNVAPQIMAFLLGVLGAPDLVEQTLDTWLTFARAIEFRDFGPHAGTTSAAIVGGWPSFSPQSRTTAAKIIEYIFLDREGRTAQRYLYEVVSLHSIPEFHRAHKKLLALRKAQPLERQLGVLLERATSENPAISAQSLGELKSFMTTNAHSFDALASGDIFSSLLGDVVDALFQCACRDGEEFEEARLAAFECIGVMGAIDPDRFDLVPEQATMTILFNFGHEPETVEFALHLIRDILTGAYRGASDINYQNNLAYALQELMRYCGFTVDLVQKPHSSLPKAIVHRWSVLPKHVVETVAALLDGRLTLTERNVEPTNLPVYPSVTTYREWIQNWSRYLIGIVKDPRAMAIFHVFRNVVRHQDVSVARHILPHIVLHCIISGTDDDREAIRLEIITVLDDQVTPKPGSSADKRLLSAQTVFNLMDHISKWMREARYESARQKRKSRVFSSPLDELVMRVESLMASIDGDVMARAAFETKAFARALMNYEMQIFQKRSQNKPESALQDYYGRLHEIYAQLDEPDGMQGVSSLVLSPSLEHQIREHESTGRWTSAQSCWEIKLQSSQNDLELHLGLIRCLRNLGHYDTMETHIRGVLSRKPDWADALAGYSAESSWMVGDWDGVQNAVQVSQTPAPEISIARLLLAIRNGEEDEIASVLLTSRKQLGSPIMAAGRQSYRRSYESVVHLHLVHDLEMAHATGKSIGVLLRDGREGKAPRSLAALTSRLSARFGATLPTFRSREPILSIHRIALGMMIPPFDAVRREISQAWLNTAKIARKSQHSQTAYSAVLQAQEIGHPFTFIESCKLIKADGEGYRALQELENALSRMPADEGFGQENTRAIAKALLLLARWRNEADRFDQKDIVLSFKQAIQTSNNWESPYFHLGRYHDEIREQVNNPAQITSHAFNTCKNFTKALEYGSKYIYHTMPRLLTLWLDTAEQPELLRLESIGGVPQQQGIGEVYKYYLKILQAIEGAIAKLPTFQWFTAFPQLVSRIEHPGKRTFSLLAKIVCQVIKAFPGQALWLFAGVVNSRRNTRNKRGLEIVNKARNDPTEGGTNLATLIDKWTQLSKCLMSLCDYPIAAEGGETVLYVHRFPKLLALATSPLILPLQSSMTVTLPASGSDQGTHRPFPSTLPTFQSFVEEIDVMKSMVKPKKLGVVGSDGVTYNWLCKPKDDLRKDARLMDFNSIINKLLKTNSESRRRRLHLRTYSVIPLNEECGLLEWVPNTIPFRKVLEELYSPQTIFDHETVAIYNRAREQGVQIATQVFQERVLPKYRPVFAEWFIATFAEPTAWLSARVAFSRTAAVISMVGCVLGLGDRHGENILLDAMSGDLVHVDFNCLFDKGKTLAIPELVPFRLTQNMVNGMGVTGVEGAFRISSEVTMQILRDNKDSLMSVLEAFVHDPLVEWEDERRKEIRNRAVIKRRPDGDNSDPHSVDVRAVAQKSLLPIERRLRGLPPAETDRAAKEITTSNQVEALIREATSPALLCMMYMGWASWL